MSAAGSPTRPSDIQSQEPTVVLPPVVNDVMVVDADDVRSMDWNEEGDVSALRKYYALKDEAYITVEESKRTWADTPFSLFAVQCESPTYFFSEAAS
jgi:serine/arginine repetitive matrix protein 2